jgi:hypothetical protein
MDEAFDTEFFEMESILSFVTDRNFSILAATSRVLPRLLENLDVQKDGVTNFNQPMVDILNNLRFRDIRYQDNCSKI